MSSTREPGTRCQSHAIRPATSRWQRRRRRLLQVSKRLGPTRRPNYPQVDADNLGTGVGTLRDLNMVTRPAACHPETA